MYILMYVLCPYDSYVRLCIHSFVAACRDHPVHLWDAYTGGLRATYTPYNHLVRSAFVQCTGVVSPIEVLLFSVLVLFHLSG